MKITLKKPPIEVPFPPDPTGIVDVKSLNRIEDMAIQQKIRQATIREPEVHPITGEPIFDPKTGQVAHRIEPLPLESIMGILQEIVLDFRGFVSEEGELKPERGKGGKIQNLGFLLDLTYETEIEVNVPFIDTTTGKLAVDETGKMRTRPEKTNVATNYWWELLDVAKGNRKTAAAVAARAAEQEAGKASPTQ